MSTQFASVSATFHTPATPVFAAWPHFDQDEVEAAAAVLRSGKVNYWTGDECTNFEKDYTQHSGCRHAIAVANGTVSLELALRALGIGPGDEVVTTPRTFIASASCIVTLGARPVFADVNPDSQNITAESILAVITPATRAIVAVHLAGWPCEMDSILELAREHDLAVIEDCAQAHGATYFGRAVGGLGDIGSFSFCQDKIITTCGEGGMLTLDSEELYQRAWSYKDHGKSLDLIESAPSTPGFRWLHRSFGTNLRLTELQAAIGRIQLAKLPAWLEIRRAHAALLTRHLSPVAGLRLALPPAHIGHAFYKYYAFLRPEALRSSWSRDGIVAEIRARGVASFSGSCSEIYLEDAFPPSWRPATRLPNAQLLGETSLMFQVHPTLSPEAVDYAGGIIADVVNEATR